MAGLTLDPLCRSGAVFQQHRPIVLSGGSTREDRVTASFGSETRSVQADANGRWQVTFPARAASGPYRVEIRTPSQCLTAQDIHVGEVWLLAGQSNMEWEIGWQHPDDRAVLQKPRPALRHFKVAKARSFHPGSTVEGTWEAASVEAWERFSAVGASFGLRLQDHLGIAIGLINATWGGSLISSWLPRSAIETRSGLGELAALLPASPNFEDHIPDRDPGRPEWTGGWETSGFDDRTWSEEVFPRSFSDRLGAGWVRRTVAVPPALRGRDLLWSLGRVHDEITAWANGVEVGRAGCGQENPFMPWRVFRVPAAVTADGTLTLVARVFSGADSWGFDSRPEDFWLKSSSGSEVLALSGPWRFSRETVLAPRHRWAREGHASTMFYGMIDPLRNAAIRGVLWYQGESDVDRAALYPWLLGELIARWRGLWGWTLEFAIVQLAAFGERRAEPVEDSWAELREAQTRVVEATNEVGMVSAVDLGEPHEIHPRFKAQLGERLALWALAEVYVCAGAKWGHPRAISATLRGDCIVIAFDQAEGLTAPDPEAVPGFEWEADDLRHAVSGRIVQGTIVLVVASPRDVQAIRYGWQRNPPTDLRNALDLPALPFRIVVTRDLPAPPLDLIADGAVS